MDSDQEHLRLLSIFHYVVAGFAALFACFPIIHLAMGIAILTGGFDKASSNGGPPSFIGMIFVVIAGTIIVLGLIFAICLMLAGRYLRQKRHYTFCLVIAGISCLFMPFGTVLGVFTIIVLTRPSVKELFISV